MAGWTNKGKFKALNNYFRAVASGVPSVSFFLLLATNTTPPTADSNKVSDISEIAAGNGYTQGGQAVSRNTTDFDVMTEDDSGDRGLVQLKDFAWTASGGALPASGLGARWLVLTLDTDDTGAAATAASGNRVILAYWDLGEAKTLADTQSITLKNFELRLDEI